MISRGSDISYPDNSAGLAAVANASKDAAIAQSGNNLLASLSQNMVMALGIVEGAKNAGFMTLAWLTDRLDGNDTKAEIVAQNARLASKEEANRHEEAGDKHKENMKELKVAEIEARRPESIDSERFTV